jgi:hypothetical protein
MLGHEGTISLGRATVKRDAIRHTVRPKAPHRCFRSEEHAECSSAGNVRISDRIASAPGAGIRSIEE